MNEKNIARKLTRHAQVVEFCRTPHSAMDVALHLKVSRQTATAYLYELKELDEPWIWMTRPSNNSHGSYVTIRDEIYEPVHRRQVEVKISVLCAPPDTPYLKFLMGYTALKPQIGTEYSDKFFDERKIGWNPDTGTRKERNAVSGSTLSMVI